MYYYWVGKELHGDYCHMNPYCSPTRLVVERVAVSRHTRARANAHKPGRAHTPLSNEGGRRTNTTGPQRGTQGEQKSKTDVCQAHPRSGPKRNRQVTASHTEQLLSKVKTPRQRLADTELGKRGSAPPPGETGHATSPAPPAPNADAARAAQKSRGRARGEAA